MDTQIITSNQVNITHNDIITVGVVERETQLRDNVKKINLQLTELKSEHKSVTKTLSTQCELFVAGHPTIVKAVAAIDNLFEVFNIKQSRPSVTTKFNTSNNSLTGSISASCGYSSSTVSVDVKLDNATPQIKALTEQVLQIEADMLALSQVLRETNDVINNIGFIERKLRAEVTKHQLGDDELGKKLLQTVASEAAKDVPALPVLSYSK